VLSAAVIIGETAGVHRFRDMDAFARFTGTAPVPVWSGAALRLLRRRLSDAVFSALRADQRTASPNPTETVMAA
jgi:transposase